MRMKVNRNSQMGVDKSVDEANGLGLTGYLVSGLLRAHACYGFQARNWLCYSALPALLGRRAQ